MTIDSGISYTGHIDEESLIQASVQTPSQLVIELARLKKEDEEKYFSRLLLSGSVLSWCLSMPLGVLLVMKTLEEMDGMLLKCL